MSAPAFAETAVAEALSRPATLASTRLIAIDGPAGSGKTTLATEVAGLTGALVLHLDDFYPGWSGIFAFEPRVLELLRPLALGETGYYRRYDWPAGEYRETHHVDPAPVLVLEGVGAGNRAWSEWVTTLVWVEAARDERVARGLARDGEAARTQWQQWMRDEDVLFATEGTRGRADLRYET